MIYDDKVHLVEVEVEVEVMSYILQVARRHLL